ncbi:hypothetical protein [Kiloniella antarctica]|uniref:Uncharacterized protein n=1 Tax=Kiloniella antarctica TaxID=1550907 RepID=A0ABW5BIT8_9PROT
MSWMLRKLSQFHETHIWVYRVASWSFALLFALCLLLAFIFLTPADILRAGRDVRPPELQAYSQYRDIFLTLGFFIFLFTSLTITLLGPFYLKHKPVTDAFLKRAKQQICRITKNSKLIRSSLWFAIIIWLLTGSIFTLWLLSGSYPPDLIETIRLLYGNATAEHFTNSIHHLFYHFLLIGCVSTLGPVFLAGYFRLKTKGEY